MNYKNKHFDKKRNSYTTQFTFFFLTKFYKDVDSEYVKNGGGRNLYILRVILKKDKRKRDKNVRGI